MRVCVCVCSVCACFALTPTACVCLCVSHHLPAPLTLPSLLAPHAPHSSQISDESALAQWWAAMPSGKKTLQALLLNRLVAKVRTHTHTRARTHTHTHTCTHTLLLDTHAHTETYARGCGLYNQVLCSNVCVCVYRCPSQGFTYGWRVPQTHTQTLTALHHRAMRDKRMCLRTYERRLQLKGARCVCMCVCVSALVSLHSLADLTCRHRQAGCASGQSKADLHASNACDVSLCVYVCILVFVSHRAYGSCVQTRLGLCRMCDVNSIRV